MVRPQLERLPLQLKTEMVDGTESCQKLSFKFAICSLGTVQLFGEED